MALSTSFRSIKIKDNLIDLGYSSTGTVAANYTYTSNMTLGGDAIVSGNTFTGTIGNGVGATNLTSISSGSSIVTDNNFIRGTGSPITYYINVTSASDQIIKNNIFDQSTVDGTIETLVATLSTRSIYHSNKNQISYASIPMDAGGFNTDLAGGNMVSNSSVTVSITGTFQSVFVNSTALRQYYRSFDLNHVLPDSVRVLAAKAGIYNVDLGSTLTSGSYAMSLDVFNIVAANFTAGTNSILDSKNNSGLYIETISNSLDLFANYAAVQASTQYLTIDTSLGNDPDNFISGKDKCMSLVIALVNDINSLGAGQDWVLSPLVIKFVW